MSNTNTKQMRIAELADYEKSLLSNGYSKLENVSSEKDLQPHQYFVKLGTANPNSFDGDKIATVILRIR